MSDAIGIGPDGRARCWWCLGDEIYIRYHDEEWGRPIRDDDELFGLMMLEGFQAGLSWRTILHRRDHFERAFDGWDARKIAAYTAEDHARLLADAGIIRNRLKVEGATKNARAFLAIQDELGSFSDYLWEFAGGETIVRPRALMRGDIQATTPESDAMSKALKGRGFTFVGSTICYAFMQSAGLVDDHAEGCWRVEG